MAWWTQQDQVLFKHPSQAMALRTWDDPGRKWRWSGSAASASTTNLWMGSLDPKRLEDVRWMVTWNPNTPGNVSPPGIRLVTWYTGPPRHDERELVRIEQPGVSSLPTGLQGNARGSANGITVDNNSGKTFFEALREELTTAHDEGRGQPIGHQMRANGRGDGFWLYSSEIQLLWRNG